MVCETRGRARERERAAEGRWGGVRSIDWTGGASIECSRGWVPAHTRARPRLRVNHGCGERTGCRRTASGEGKAGVVEGRSIDWTRS